MRNEGKSNHMDEGWKLGKEEKVNGELTLEQNVPGVGSPRPPFMAHCTTKCFPPVSCSRALFTGIRPIIRYRDYDESQWPNFSVIHLAVLSSSRSPTRSLYCIVPVKYCYTSSTVPESLLLSALSPYSAPATKSCSNSHNQSIRGPRPPLALPIPAEVGKE